MKRRSFLKAVGVTATLAATNGLAVANEQIKIRDLYTNGTHLSELAKNSEGQYITIEGYMAPPLQAQSQFFVLTKMPLAVCPFCDAEADWPDDILAVYTKRIVKVKDFNVKIKVRGILRLGKHVDKDTGFLSMARLENAVYE